MIASGSPRFSVIVPTRDRPEQLSFCLQALRQQSFADGFEVIVVDDGSRQPVVADAALADTLNLTVVRQPVSRGPSIARNCGAAQARGRFLAFTDDDCAPAVDWLQKLSEEFERTPEALLGGQVINALVDNRYSCATHAILDAIYEYYDPRQGRAHFFPTSNFALPRNRFFDLDGFSEEWPLAAAEDREFCYRWLKRDYAMIFVPQARVYHRHALNLDSFCQLHFRYGRGAYEYHRLRAGGTGQGSLKPDWRFHWSCLCYPFRHMPPSQAIPTVALLVIWQAANAAGYFWQRVTAEPKDAKRPRAG